jgi:hydrogenase/urease accessory protein HupE
MKRAWRVRTLSLILALQAGPAAAHVTATGLAQVTVDADAVTYRLTLMLSELPADPAQLLARATRRERVDAERIADALRAHVTIRVNGEACRPGRIIIRGVDLGEPKALLEYGLHCAAAPGRLDLEENWTDFLGPHYRTIVTIATPRGGTEYVLGEETPRVSVDFGAPAPSGLFSFVRLGVTHILTGYDHLLFLLALLIGASNFWRVLAIVTAFTLAHSITLSLAVLGFVHAPGAIVEPLIAASIVWVALGNLLGQSRPWDRIAVTFVFGLVHGLGFADALSQLALSGWALARALVGFNLGVELGQGLAVGVALPVFFYIGTLKRATLMVRTASFTVAMVGAYWFVERVFFG